MKKTIKYFFILLGAFLLALGLNQFLVPQKLSTGGIGTIATVLKYLFNVPLSITNVVLNGILFVFGIKLLGKSALIKTLWGILTLSVFLEVTAFLPIYSEDTLVACVLGGTLVGLGIGIVIRQGASTGGSDFLALMLYKYFPHISIAKIILAIDLIIVSISAIIFKSVTVGAYSLIALIISSKIADAILVLGDSAKTVYVLSEKSQEIADKIMAKFNRGVTGIFSKGMYLKKEGYMLLSAVRPKEVPNLVNYIKQLDSKAFIIIQDAHEVFGEGFKPI